MKTTFFKGKMFWLLAVLFACTISATAQNTATVTGTVMNENGELLPRVTVKASNTENKESFTGQFLKPELQPTKKDKA